MNILKGANQEFDMPVVQTMPSPSPRPSPSGRGGNDSSAPSALKRLDSAERGITSSLSQRERAGVRGRRAHGSGLRPKTNFRPILKTIQFLLTLTAIGLFVAGCATPNVNPPQARANTGYVDFHADASAGLSWEVARWEDHKREFQRVFWELEPPPGGVLRLAFVPGRYRLRVTFLNRVITKPVEIAVEVQDGKVLPVRVTLTEAGTTLVRTKEESRGGTAYGRYGRRTKIGSDESVMYDISATAEPPVDYQPKEQMPYAR